MKYHEVSFKASHNSFDRDESIHEQLNFFPNNPSRCGCAAYPLVYYLGLLLSFHLNNPNHDPILVTIDIKSYGNKLPFPHEIDGYLTRFFNRALLFTPVELFKIPRISLCENVIRFGWSDTSLMKGKFIFCLSGTKKWKNFYAASNIKSKLCFADKHVDDDDPNIFIPVRGNFVFF